jgi:ABC-2 type transport system permease protein
METVQPHMHIAEQAVHPRLFLPAISLAWRELKRFFRQRHRVIGALGTPVVFWLLVGAGMGRSLQFAGAAAESYLVFFYPGALVMILLFTAIFSTLSIIDDRREGFLQSVLVAPVRRESIVLGKLLGGTALATAQGVLFLALAPLAGYHLGMLSLPLVIALIAIISFALSGLGFCIAWSMVSSQGFHAIMNLFLMPMWFLSGALFPLATAWWGLRWIMWVNPLTYGVAALRHAMLLGDERRPLISGPDLTTGIIVTCIFATLFFAASVFIARRPSRADTQ